MRLFPILLPALLCACDMPSPHLRGGERLETQIDGHRLTIWRKGSDVEIIRHGYAPRATQTGLQARMVAATQAATGCSLPPASIDGDTGVLRARLACD
jgi:hypothetical protein